MMPEVHGKEILEDTDTFWEWFRGDNFAPNIYKAYRRLNPNFHLKIDKHALLVSGESAGGFLAAYSLLSQPKVVISCMFLQYPMLRSYIREAGHDYMGVKVSPAEVQTFAKKHIEELKLLEKEGKLKPRRASYPPDGMAMAYVMSSAKLPKDYRVSYWKHWFAEKDILERLQDIEAGKAPRPPRYPRTYILHGKEDKNCPWEDSQYYEWMLNKLGPDMVTLILRENEAHAFDYSCEVDDEAHKDWLPQLKGHIESAWDYFSNGERDIDLLEDTADQTIMTRKYHLAGNAESNYTW
jgi:acetyl esterase/lipase